MARSIIPSRSGSIIQHRCCDCCRSIDGDYYALRQTIGAIRGPDETKPEAWLALKTTSAVSLRGRALRALIRRSRHPQLSLRPLQHVSLSRGAVIVTVNILFVTFAAERRGAFT